MFKKIGVVVSIIGLCGLSFFLLNCGNGSSRPAGLLYAISQAENNITSYAINLNNGGLSMINSNATTCSTLSGRNPVSCGLAVDLLLDPTKSVGFLLNQGIPCASGVVCPSITPTIYSYTVNSDGSFSNPVTPVTWVHPTSGSDTQDDGDTAVAMTQDSAGQFLYVINQGSVQTPANNNLLACPQQPTGNFDACPSISVFITKPGSTGATLTGNDCTANNGGPCPFRLSRVPTALSVITFTPPNGSSAQTMLFVTSDLDLTANHNDNQLSVYSVDSSGNLTEQPNSPYTTTATPQVVMAVNTNAPPQSTGGVFVYVGTQGSSAGTVTAYQVCTVVGSQGTNNTCTQQQVADNQLLQVGSPLASGQDPWSMVVDPSNSFLYVAAKGSNQVFAYGIATGSGVLSALSPASQAVGAAPVSLAMHGNYNFSNEYLFVSSNVGQSLTGFQFGYNTGSLSSAGITLFTPGAPSGIAVK